MTQSLTIALVSPDYPPDPKGTGIGTYTKLLAHYLTERGHKVHVITKVSLNAIKLCVREISASIV